MSRDVLRFAGSLARADISALAAIGMGALGLAGCSDTSTRQQQASFQPMSTDRLASLPATPVAYNPATPGEVPGRPVQRTQGVYKVGKPYVVNGQTYYPAEDPSYDRVGTASWYGTDFHAKQTANGESFDMNTLTAAHPTLPLPSYLYVTNLRNGRTVIVRVNDRGPYKPNRIIDLSRYTANVLGFEGHGTTEVRVRYAGPAPLNPMDDRRERQFLAQQPWSQMVRGGSRPGWGRPAALGMETTASR